MAVRVAQDPIAPSTPITLEHGATVLDSLYTGLTETQRQAVDTLFAEQALAACHPRTPR